VRYGAPLWFSSTTNALARAIEEPASCHITSISPIYQYFDENVHKKKERVLKIKKEDQICSQNAPNTYISISLVTCSKSERQPLSSRATAAVTAPLSEEDEEPSARSFKVLRSVARRAPIPFACSNAISCRGKYHDGSSPFTEPGIGNLAGTVETASALALAALCAPQVAILLPAAAVVTLAATLPPLALMLLVGAGGDGSG
jgi:hypothetical protein